MHWLPSTLLTSSALIFSAHAPLAVSVVSAAFVMPDSRTDRYPMCFSFCSLFISEIDSRRMDDFSICRGKTDNGDKNEHELFHKARFIPNLTESAI